MPDSLVTVSNIRVDVDTQRVRILYDVVGIAGSDLVYIQVESRAGDTLNAKTVTGDVGKGVPAGQNKTIYWDYRLDGIELVDEVRVTVLVKHLVLPMQRRNQGGGPSNALVSALVPGLGTIFVQPNKKIGLRPLITVAYGGLLVYGLLQKNRSKQQYQRYEDFLNEFNSAEAERFYTEANQLNHRYLLAIGAAVAVWGTDVVYTFLKGRKNLKQKRIVPRRVVINYINRTPTVGVQFSF
ncbi:MAG: hypothetical protein LH606_13585 [Cytophagaceae bacterium]|nr:hypothetical protein [Cytophagaceae bacterium]